MFRKNLIDAIQKEQDIKMRITPGSETTREIITVLRYLGMKCYIFKDDEFILIYKNKAVIRSQEYIAVSATNNTIPFAEYDRINYTEYFPETDTFAEDQEGSRPNFRNAVKLKKEFFAAGSPGFIRELAVIAEEEGIDLSMARDKGNILCFAFSIGSPVYCAWDQLTEGVTVLYLPEQDKFRDISEIEKVNYMDKYGPGANTCEECAHLEDGGCTETEGNCPMQKRAALPHVSTEDIVSFLLQPAYVDNVKEILEIYLTGNPQARAEWNEWFRAPKVPEKDTVAEPVSREITFNPESDCHVNGHSLVHVTRFDNGCSVWGEMLCQKCGKVHEWQYDYNPNAYGGHEPKPF